MERLRLIALSLLAASAVGIVARGALADDSAGVIEGVVTVKGSKGVPPDGPLVVYVRGPGPPPPRAADKRVTQLNMRFEPNGVTIAAGDRVEFPNRDVYFHNVFSVDPGSAFTLGLVASGDSRNQSFEQPGVVHVYCNEHPNMAMELLVLENAWFAEVGPDGRFRIEGVAPGPRTVSVWSPVLEEHRQATVDVGAGGTARVEFLDLRKAGPDSHSRSNGQPYYTYQ